MLPEDFTFDATRLLGEGLAGATGGTAVGSDFESGANEPMIMSIATTAIAIAHHRRHQVRFCRAEAVGGGADQVVACVGGACSECGVQAVPFQYRMRPGVVGSGYQPAFVDEPVVVIWPPDVPRPLPLAVEAPP